MIREWKHGDMAVAGHDYTFEGKIFRCKKTHKMCYSNSPSEDDLIFHELWSRKGVEKTDE